MNVDTVSGCRVPISLLSLAMRLGTAFLSRLDGHEHMFYYPHQPPCQVLKRRGSYNVVLQRTGGVMPRTPAGELILTDAMLATCWPSFGSSRQTRGFCPYHEGSTLGKPGTLLHSVSE
jgi:hypothetical protein